MLGFRREKKWHLRAQSLIGILGTISSSPSSWAIHMPFEAHNIKIY